MRDKVFWAAIVRRNGDREIVHGTNIDEMRRTLGNADLFAWQFADDAVSALVASVRLVGPPKGGSDAR